MNKKAGVELGIGSIAVIILFAVVAFIVLMLIFTYQPVITGALSDSVCKINVFFRASTIGNPVIQTMMGTASYLIGGFGGVTTSLINIPLACFPGEAIDYSDYVTLDVLVKKLYDEAVRCWDNFGNGHLDSLMMYEGGNQFTCFEQTMDILCDSNPDCSENDRASCPTWVKNMYMAYGEKYQGLPKDQDGIVVVTQEFLDLWSTTHYYTPAGSDIEKSYAKILGGESNPFLGSRGVDFNIICDGRRRKIIVGLYYVDKFFSPVSRVRSPTETLCWTVPEDQASDMLILCTYDISGLEVFE